MYVLSVKFEDRGLRISVSDVYGGFGRRIVEPLLDEQRGVDKPKRIVVIVSHRA